MLTLTVTYTRSDTSVEFFQPTSVEPTWKELLDTYKAAGKLIAIETRVGGQLITEPIPGNGQPTMEIKSIWRSIADNLEFINEPMAETVRDARIAYCLEHGIQVEYTRQVDNDQYDLP